MKTTRFLTLMAAALMMALSACKPDPLDHFTDSVKVTTAQPTFISGTTATCGAEVEADDNGLLIELGVCWSESEHPTNTDNTMSTHRCTQPYTCLLTQLKPETKYYLRGYAKYGTEYVYGEEKSFTTLDADAPVHSPVTTHEAFEVTYSYFRASVSLEPFGVNSYYVGICWSTQPEFTFEDCDDFETGYYDIDLGDYVVVCDQLTSNTTYYYRAFVEYGEDSYNPDNYFYGEILSVTTPEIPFILNIYTDYCDYSHYSQYIYANGNGFCTRPELISQVGFCYSTTNQTPEYESDLHTIAATPTGEYFEFSNYLFNVSANKKYFIRSYARYKTDSIKYGNVVVVDTD